MARMMGGEEEGGRKALGFMYEGGRIPGLHRDKNDAGTMEDVYETELPRGKGEAEGKSDSLFERQPGDDDAAAAFRAMLARGAVEDAKPSADEGSNAIDAAGAIDESQEEKAEHVDNRTNLEKAVGRRIKSGDLTLTQQMERFPMLKNAPMVLQKPKDGEQQQSNDVAGLNFKPLGQVLRNVKCMSCGKWGHSKGDRECEVSGWDPFSMSAPIAPVAKAPDSSTQVDPIDKPKEIDEYKSDKRKRKKEKRRNKEDKHKRKHKHKRRRRSPSYSSDSDSDRRRHDDDSSHDRRHKKEARHRSSSRRSKRTRERSRSPSYYSDDSRR